MHCHHLLRLCYSKTRRELTLDFSGLIPNLNVYNFIDLEDATEIMGHRVFKLYSHFVTNNSCF